MINLTPLQMNKISYLHDDEDIVFCKTDSILQEFERIRTFDRKVVLVSGNSDYCINEQILSRLPDNVYKWFAQNSLVKDDRIICIPIGYENTIAVKREGHGIINVIEKNGVGYNPYVEELIFLNHPKKEPTKFIYANFRVVTFKDFHLSRETVREYCMNTSFIDWEEPYIGYDEFLHKILDYEAVVCPQGNGPGDNTRIMKTLILGRIPITFNKVMYENLHYRYPVVFIENIDDLTNYDLMRSKIDQAKEIMKNWNKQEISCEFWIDQIRQEVKKMKSNE